MFRSMFLTIALILVLAVPAVADWEGSEELKDGVRFVNNPETAVEEVSIKLEELWRRGDEDDDVFFGLPSEILQGKDGNIYILDTQVSEILVFTPDGEYLRTIGREGEGPGEFRDANDMYQGPDDVLGVVSIFPGKIVQLMPDGGPADNFRLPEENTEGFQLVFKGEANGERIVICGARQISRDGSNAQDNYLKAFDKNGTELAHFHTMEERTQYGGMKFDEKVFANFKGRWSMAPNGRVAAVLAFDYEIHVWDADGKLNHVIARPGHAPLKRSDAQMVRFQKLYDGVTNWNPNSSFKISDTHRPVFQIWYRPDGSLWALTDRGIWGRSDGVFAAFDVYDPEGRFVRRVQLTGEGSPADDGIFFVGDRLFIVSGRFGAVMAQFGGDEDTDMEDSEPLQVIAYDIDLPEMGMNR